MKKDITSQPIVSNLTYIRQCPICHSADTECLTHVNVPWSGGWVQTKKKNIALVSLPVIHCNDCQFIYNGRKPSTEESKTFYAEDYVSSNISPAENILNVEEAKFIEMICNHKHAGSILEIGCYDGRLLSEFQKRGWKVSGCELSNAADIADKRLLKPVIRQPFSADLFKGTLLDVIFCRYVLEHIDEPVLFLKEMTSLLGKNGFIAVEVPDMQCRLADGVLGIFAHEHIGYYVRFSLAQTFMKAGMNPFLCNSSPQGLTIFGAMDSRPFNGRPLDIIDTGQLIARWNSLKTKKKGKLKSFLRGLLSRPKSKILLIGADSHTYELLNSDWLDEDCSILISDDDPRKVGKVFIGTDVTVNSVENGIAARPEVAIVSTYYSSQKIAHRILKNSNNKIPIITLYPDVRLFEKQ